MGLSARMSTLAHKWVKDIADCYDLIQSFHMACPYGWKKGCVYACHPATMADERRTAEQWIENRVSFKHPIHFEYFLTHLADHNNTNNSATPLNAGSTMMDHGRRPPADDELGVPVADDDLGVPVADDDLGVPVADDDLGGKQKKK